MSLGVHFALADDDLERLLQIGDPDELQAVLTEEIEETYLRGDPRWAFQSDKAWDAIHRCLTDGDLLYESGPFPLAYAVLGGEPLDAGHDYTACLVNPEQVAHTHAAMVDVTREHLRARYDTLGDTDYATALSDADFDYTWRHFEGLRTFFGVAADSGRHVLFTTDC
jgi:hypothetical protein